MQARAGLLLNRRAAGVFFPFRWVTWVEGKLKPTLLLLIEDLHAGRYFESGTFRMSVPYPSLDEVAEPQNV